MKRTRPNTVFLGSPGHVNGQIRMHNFDLSTCRNMTVHESEPSEKRSYKSASSVPFVAHPVSPTVSFVIGLNMSTGHFADAIGFDRQPLHLTFRKILGIPCMPEIQAYNTARTSPSCYLDTGARSVTRREKHTTRHVGIPRT